MTIRADLPGNAAVAALSFDGSEQPYLLDHAVRGVSVVSGASMVAGLFALDANRYRHLQNLSFDNMLPVSNQETVTLQVHATNDTLALTDGDGRSTYAAMQVGNGQEPALSAASPDIDGTRFNGAQLYAKLRQQGNEYGPGFQTIVSVNAGQGSARANWQVLPSADKNQRLTLLLDACTHVAALSARLQSTYVLKSIGQVWLSLGDSALAQEAVITVSTNRVDHNGCVASVCIDGTDGQRIAEIVDLELVFLESAPLPDEVIAVAGTFTLDPLAPTFQMWARELNLSMGVQFADYGQVFQELLSDDGVFNANAAAHVSFLRLEDWVRTGATRKQPSKEDLDAKFGDLKRHDLADGRIIAELNPYETAYLYREIFVDHTYRRHGVGVLDGDTVIDIGANIGMFSLFATDQANDVRVIAIEPSPSVLPILRANLAAYSPNSTVVAAGASDKIGEAEFTAYPNSSVFSTFASDLEADKDALGAIIRNTLIASGHSDPAFLDEAVDELLDERLEAETYKVPLISVSDVIREQGVTQIGLLKIDAEKSEDAILSGIDAEHWPLIEQMIIEVHTQDGRGLESVTSLLTEKGFEWVEDEEQLLADSGLVTLYASRPERRERVAANSPVHAAHESADLYLDAVGARAARTTQPLLTVICPATTRDPVLRASLSVLQDKLINDLNALGSSEATTWDELTRHYPVKEIADEVGDQLGHIPYSPAWYGATGSALVRRHLANRRAPTKVLALDCDNTLWAGVVGEAGPAGIELTAGHLALQKFAKAQIDQGMLVCLVSKNNEGDVAEVFAQRNDFLLTADDCVTQRINWDPKSGNLQSIAQELNLGLDSFIFIDDSPVECAEVRAALPEVLTLQLPSDDALIANFLDHIWPFDKTGATNEDRRRAQLYKQESQRNAFKGEAASLESFIDGLKLNISVKRPETSQMERVAQMTKRTNQFNLTTIRREVADVERELAGSMQCRVVDVSDRFGDYGITGLVLFNVQEQQLLVDTLLLSCRVLGRGVEHSLMASLGKIASDQGATQIVLPFKDSGKNEPAKRFLDTLPAERGASGQLVVASDVAATLKYTPQTVNAAANAVAAKAKRDLPAAPSVRVENIALTLNSVTAILERANTRVAQPRPELAAAFVPARNEAEQQIADIWCSVLGLTEVGIDDSFFLLGGTSLLGVQMVSLVQQAMPGKISVVDLFDAPTIRALSQVLEGGGSDRVAASKERGAARRSQAGARRRTRG